MSFEKMTNFLGLWSPVCGSSQVLWTGSTLEAAALEWQRLVAQQPDEKVDLTAYGRGEVASHRELEWRYGTPKASFACPIYGKETPHEHTGEAIAWHRDLEAWKQRDMEKRWERIEARIAELTALSWWTGRRTNMGDLVGLPGVAGGRIKDVQWASSVSGAMRVLLTERAVTGAGDHGAWTVWKDDAGLYRADFSRHHITLSETTFVTKAGVKDWLREWLPKSTDGVEGTKNG